MANQERTFQAGDQTYTIRFSQNALYRLEQALGRPIAEINHNFGMATVQTMLWAGLEGARLKHKQRSTPYTIDDAGEIIEAGTFAKVWPVVLDAWKAAWPSNEGGEPGTGGEKTENPS